MGMGVRVGVRVRERVRVRVRVGVRVGVRVHVGVRVRVRVRVLNLCSLWFFCSLIYFIPLFIYKDLQLGRRRICSYWLSGMGGATREDSERTCGGLPEL